MKIYIAFVAAPSVKCTSIWRHVTLNMVYLKTVKWLIIFPECLWYMPPIFFHAYFWSYSVTLIHVHDADWHVLPASVTCTILITVHPQKQKVMNQWNRFANSNKDIHLQPSSCYPCWWKKKPEYQTVTLHSCKYVLYSQ